VHERDVTRRLLDEKVRSADAFGWQCHLRLYYASAEREPDKTKQLALRMGSTEFSYDDDERVESRRPPTSAVTQRMDRSITVTRTDVGAPSSCDHHQPPPPTPLSSSSGTPARSCSALLTVTF
jgi:hypothetical protein